MKENEIIEAIAYALEIDKERLNNDTKRESIEEWDSLGHIEIISELEERLNIKIPFEGIADIEKVSDFFKYA
ncbi:acyl carrier protein [Clostridium scatologenes]|uniref:Phosphopantetheine-binding n=1 Tax=Clostridium scatologenes TaxID=1548 RepID=A0A0E3JPK5_CLOSL|nr:acyl carrier protein [Clostridium scatologenes]AKA70304.1 phosphopantetheine-binding [Clostridium scatologenes]